MSFSAEDFEKRNEFIFLIKEKESNLNWILVLTNGIMIITVCNDIENIISITIIMSAI